MIQEEQSIKIGDLLVKAGLLNRSDVIESIQVSQRLQIPIGRVLIMAGTVTEHLLQAALQAQLLVKEGLVSTEAACEALHLAVSENKTLQQAFHQLNISPGAEQDMSEYVVELLLDSNIVTQDQLEEAMHASNEADMPLSGALVLQGVLSMNFFPTIQRAAEQIQSGQLSREEAIDDLKSSFMLWLRAEESMKTGGFDGQFDRLDMLASTPVYEPPQLNSREHSKQSASTEELLTADDLGPVPSPIPQSTTAPAHRAVSSFIPAVESASEQSRVVDLYMDAGIFGQAEIQKAYAQMLEDPELSGSVFFAMGLTDEPTLKFAARCHNLVKKGLLTHEQAVQALRNHRAGLTSPQEALNQETAETHPYFDDQWRKKTLRTVGGGLVGALVAGLALSKAFKRD